MTREEYIMYRNQGSHEYLYEYYTENFDKSKHNPFLNKSEFYQFFTLWPGSVNALSIVTDYYDIKFNVFKIPNKDGNLIMCI